MSEDKRISTRKLIYFAAPGFVSAIMHGPSGGILTGVYAKYFGVSLAALGTAMLVGRLFDAFTDPLVGAYSDSLKSRWGRRHSLMFLAALPSAFFFSPDFSQRPSPGASASGAELFWGSSF